MFGGLDMIYVAEARLEELRRDLREPGFHAAASEEKGLNRSRDLPSLLRFASDVARAFGSRRRRSATQGVLSRTTRSSTM